MNTDTPPEPRTILLAPQRHLLVSFDPLAGDWRGSLLEGTALSIHPGLVVSIGSASGDLVLRFWFLVSGPIKR